MRLGSNRAVAALAMVFGVLGSSNLGAVRPEPVAEDSGLITPVWVPGPRRLRRPKRCGGFRSPATRAVGKRRGLQGGGVKIEIIDPGIDYTPAISGGPAPAAPYGAPPGREPLPADPRLFGPSA